MVHTATKEHKHCCPQCKSCDVDIVEEDASEQLICLDCGYEGVE